MSSTTPKGGLPHLLLVPALWAVMICAALTAARTVRRKMNQHGHDAMTYWKANRPTEYARLENPEAFFADLGAQIATTIATLAPQLAGPDLRGEGYLDKIARLAGAKAQATEIALSESGAYPEPELTFEEWQATTLQTETGLIDWALRTAEIAEFGTTDRHTPTIEDTAETYLLPARFLQEMVSSTSPVTFLDEPTNRTRWLASVKARWARDRDT